MAEHSLEKHLETGACHLARMSQSAESSFPIQMQPRARRLEPACASLASPIYLPALRISLQWHWLTSDEILLAFLHSTGTPLIYASRRLWPLEICGFCDEAKANHRENLIPGMKQKKPKTTTNMLHCGGESLMEKHQSWWEMNWGWSWYSAVWSYGGMIQGCLTMLWHESELYSYTHMLTCIYKYMYIHNSFPSWGNKTLMPTQVLWGVATDVCGGMLSSWEGPLRIWGSSKVCEHLLLTSKAKQGKSALSCFVPIQQLACVNSPGHLLQVKISHVCTIHSTSDPLTTYWCAL